jgi:hypothetical protein
MAAVGARLLLQLPHPELRGADLELPLLRVLQELRRTQDRVHERPNEWKERRAGGAGDEHRILDPATGVEEGPGDQRDPHHDEEEDDEVHEQVEAAVRDAE